VIPGDDTPDLIPVLEHYLIVSPEWNEPSGEEAFPSPVKNDLL
jgi:hypothetical protein